MESCRNKIVYRFSSAFRQHFTSYFATPPPLPQETWFLSRTFFSGTWVGRNSLKKRMEVDTPDFIPFSQRHLQHSENALSNRSIYCLSHAIWLTSNKSHGSYWVLKKSTASTLKFPKTTTWNETTQIWYMALQWYSELFFVGEFDMWHCNHYNYIVIRCD